MYSSSRIDQNVSLYMKKNLPCIPNDLLNDLSSRFIINVPEEERSELTRVCFQIELAHWFYNDFYLEEDSKLPKVKLYDFFHIIFRHIPFLQKYSVSEVDTAVAKWREYKKAVPTYGAILLDQDLKNVLLVQSFVYKASWGFPKGKVNKDELPQTCAIREVIEETGFDISDLIDTDAYLEYTFNEQLIRLYIIPGVPSDTIFIPTTRNEIKDCEWFPVNQLPVGKKQHESTSKLSPNNFFMVVPFVKQLKKWISNKISHHNKEKINVDNSERQVSRQQQQLLAQLNKDGYASLSENASLVDNRASRLLKSAYSPPPRMLRQKNVRHGGEDKKRQSQATYQSVDRIETHSKLNRKPGPDSTKHEKFSADTKQFEMLKSNSQFISNAWQNFSLDREALVATFNINLRKTSMKMYGTS